MERKVISPHLPYGFALPTILIASFVMLLVLTSTMASVTATTTSLRNQSVNMLAKEAADSGVAFARACLIENGGVVTWSDANPLRPNTDCTGGPACSDSPSCFIHQSTNLHTTFMVPAADALYDSTYSVQAEATAELLRSSTQLPWRTFNAQNNAVITLNEEPKVSGGAGWKETGHLGIVLTRSNQLYGFGDNQYEQLLTPASGAVQSPSRINLPVGVTYVKNVYSSGQGAMYVCIIGSDDQAYCRGKPGGGEQSFTAVPSWNKISGWPTNYKVYDAFINGWGSDAGCFIVGTTQATAQVYCVGDPRWGEMGTGYNCPYWGGPGTCNYYLSNNAQRFQLPTNTYAKNVVTMNDQTCVLTTSDDVYCSGLNNGGQVTGANTLELVPVKFNLPNNRKAKQVLIAGYHDGSSQTVRVLATDGTIWSAGWNGYGAFGTGVTGGNTASTQTPELFGGFGVSSGTTGDQIRMKNLGGKCIDNSSWANANGNPIVIWDCGPMDNRGQRWLYNTDTHGVTNVDTGKCLDVPSANFYNTAPLQLWDCNGSNAQRFSIQANGSITADVNSSYCIDLPGAVTTNGTGLQIHACNGTNAQLFSFGMGFNAWQGMIVGLDTFCAVRDDAGSGIWCAGRNQYGQLGNNGTLIGGGVTGSLCGDSATPLQMQLPSGESVDWTKLSLEWSYQFDSLMVISKTGKVYGSGRNLYGKLGNGILGDASKDYRTCYVRQTQLPTGVAALDMSTRDEYSTYIVGNDLNIYSMGWNNAGQLGIGSTASQLGATRVNIPNDSFILY